MISRDEANGALLDAAKAEVEDVEAVKNALDAGADINAVDSKESTALIWAAFNGHYNIVNLLLDRGANINAVDSKRYSALIWAANMGHKYVVTLLCAYGADPFIVNKYCDAAWSFADDEIKAIIKTHEAYMQLKYGLLSALSIGAILLSSDPMLHAGLSVLAFGASCYFNGVKSYEARSVSFYLASTALWCSTSLVEEEYSVYCQIGAGVIAASTILYAAYPYLTTPSPEQGI